MTLDSSLRIIDPDESGACDSCDTEFPSRFVYWHTSQGRQIELAASGTHFGFLRAGRLVVDCDSGRFLVGAGMYFSLPGEAQLSLDSSESGCCGMIASRLHSPTSQHRGFFQIGGPVEQRGRLTYIDGCSDSLLISPVVLGAPCLNLLYLPPHTKQTSHTHPSCRMGMIVSGSGWCRTPGGSHRLVAGTKFLIEPDGQHSFHTEAEALRVIAWHPDSDFGPANQDHPMINRTMIDGVSAARLAGGRTD